jgi:hypothetical protein
MPAFMCTDPGSCDGFLMVIMALLAVAAIAVVAFGWGVWYGVSRRLRRRGVSRAAANVVGLVGAALPPLAVWGVARSGVFAVDAAVWAVGLAPFVSLAFGLTTWRRERGAMTTTRGSAEWPDVGPLC